MANTRASISTPWRKRIKFVKFTNFIRNLFARCDSCGEYWRKLLRTWNAIKQGAKRRKFSRSNELSSSPDDCCVKLSEIKCGENFAGTFQRWKNFAYQRLKMIISRLSSCLFVVFVRSRAFFIDNSIAFADEDKTRYFTRNLPSIIEAAGVVPKLCVFDDYFQAISEKACEKIKKQ